MDRQLILSHFSQQTRNRIKKCVSSILAANKKSSKFLPPIQQKKLEQCIPENLFLTSSGVRTRGVNIYLPARTVRRPLRRRRRRRRRPTIKNSV